MEELIQYQEHHSRVQEEIYEIMDNQDNVRLRNNELQAVIEGYNHYLEKEGYSSMEISKILSTLKYERFMS